MKREQITGLIRQLEDARREYDGVEYWSARDLQIILGYKQWRTFVSVVEKAASACVNSNIPAVNHFAESRKLILAGKGAEREVDDFSLTRYACYLVAQNGDSSKEQIAFAQTYFAVQTRRQELIEKRLLDIDRVRAREKLTKSEKKLSGVIYERGVDERGFGRIRSAGDSALFGGWNTSKMKQRLRVPTTRPLADFLPTLTIKAKDFATELTSHNVVEKDLNGERSIRDEHIDNNAAVRKMLLERGVRPETLPPSEDVKKVQRRIDGEEKKLHNDVKKGLSEPKSEKGKKKSSNR